MDKKKLERKILREKYKGLSRSYKDLASAEIARAIFSMRWYEEAKTIFCYMSRESEVGTEKIIDGAAKDGKKICIPKCLGNGIMESRLYLYKDEIYPLEIGTWGIREPLAESPLVEPEEIDLAIIPCLTCDKEGNRLGHGAGYYDRFFSNEKGLKASKVCICFSQIMADYVYTDKHDVKMNAVVTEENTYYE